jgi:hypothetical protein
MTDQCQPGGAGAPLLFQLAHLRREFAPQQVRNLIRFMSRESSVSRAPWFVGVGGWDEDPRPLAAIPEARTLVRTAIRNGMLALMSAGFGELEKFIPEEQLPLDGYLLWQLGFGRLDAQQVPQLYVGWAEHYRLDFDRAEKALYALLRTPAPKGWGDGFVMTDSLEKWKKRRP